MSFQNCHAATPALVSPPKNTIWNPFSSRYVYVSGSAPDAAVKFKAPAAPFLAFHWLLLDCCLLNSMNRSAPYTKYITSRSLVAPANLTSSGCQLANQFLPIGPLLVK